jgi:hypothetical protein
MQKGQVKVTDWLAASKFVGKARFYTQGKARFEGSFFWFWTENGQGCVVWFVVLWFLQDGCFPLDQMQRARLLLEKGK